MCVYAWMCAPECSACGGQRRTTGTLHHLSSPIRVTFKTPLYKCSAFSNKCRVLIFKYVHDFQYVEQIVSKIYFYLIETYVIKSNKTMFVTNFYKFFILQYTFMHFNKQFENNLQWSLCFLFTAMTGFGDWPYFTNATPFAAAENTCL